MGKTLPPGKMLRIILISCLVVTAFSVPIEPRADCAAADDYIDEVLVGVQDMIKEEGYDPAELPSGEDGFSTIHRTGATELCVTDHMELKANIGLRKPTAGYHVSAEFMGVSVGASAEAEIASIDIYFEASATVGDSVGLDLTRFEITNVGHIDVEVHGLGPLDWILGKLVGALADTIKGWIIPVIEGPIRDILQDIIDDMLPPTVAKIVA